MEDIETYLLVINLVVEIKLFVIFAQLSLMVKCTQGEELY
jgi:hypothetical protein